LSRVKRKLATTVLVVASLVVATLSAVTMTARPARAATGPAWPIDTWGTPSTDDNVVLKWNEQLLSTIRAYPPKTGPTITARALGVVHTAIYDAWAAYEPNADPTRPDGPPKQTDTTGKTTAINYAAYEALNDLFPSGSTQFPAKTGYSTPDVLYTTLEGHAPPVPGTTVAGTPEWVGDKAAEAVLNYRHSDGSNQQGGYAGTCQAIDCYPGPFSTWDTVVEWHWQPLCVPLVTSWTPCPSPTTQIQKPLTPQWGSVKPFGPIDPTTHLPPEILPSVFHPPYLADGSCCDPADIDQALRDTSSLTDAQKAKAEYWADGPKSEFPPGHMALFAQALSRMHNDSLDQDVKLFFALGNAMMDSSIAAWGIKYKFDFWRPVTAIRFRYRDKKVNSWLGPKLGYGNVLGQDWKPYQLPTVVTPAFPEYVSGHSTFSAAGRSVLLSFFGTDSFNAKVTIKAGSSQIEPDVTPAKAVVLSWNTLTAAGDEAGMSRRYGGIHFKTGDEHGRALGKQIGFDDWALAQKYFNGTATP
jgi:PAP2 superfamily